jgi:hypothetical protein
MAMTSLVDWGAFHPEDLLGANDPYTLDALAPGETVVYCENCRLGYHASTVDFLRRENGGRCTACNIPNRWRTFTLPGSVPVTPETAVTTTETAGTLVKLDRIWEHVGQFVTFEGYVHRVYQSRSSGTWFVQFEDTRNPLESFRLVIYNRYTRVWTDAGLNIEDYAKRTIRVRGLIRNDPMWGIQILIDRPDVITFVDDGKPDGEDDMDPVVLDQFLFDPQADDDIPDPDGSDGTPTQRIIWKI